MKKLYILITALFISTAANQAVANTMVRVKAIGSSPRGQFVAIEEFGYKDQRKKPYSKIRIMNVWKNKYVGIPVNVISHDDKMELNQVRAKAKNMAEKKLKRFNIST